MSTATINGTELYFEIYGNGPPLLLLMGLGAHGSLWREHIAAYTKHFRCIVPDNRGVGRSGQPPGPYTTAQMADDCAALIQAYDSEPVHVSGISMGGAIAQELALRHPSLVRRLILNCTWGRCDAYMRRIFETLRALAPTSPPRDFIRLVYLIIFTPAYHATKLDDLLRREEELLSNPNPQSADAFAAQCDACISHDALDRLTQIKAPTLITVGQNDIFTPLKCAQELHRAIRGSELAVFEGCGHAHHWEKLEEYNARTTRFLIASEHK
jgi:pimeloyl-ACP methyl ester carboxylesterase